MISYMITSTLTRPTTISPTLSNTRTIDVVEIVNVALVEKPDPQTISIANLPKRQPATTPSNDKATTTATDVALASNGDPQASETRMQRLISTPLSKLKSSSNDIPRSRASTEVSFASTTSSSDQSNPTSSRPRFSRTSTRFSQRTATSSVPGKAVSGMVELLSGGCLPGEVIPLRISINYNRRITNTQGIVVTLYRQARIDTHPAIPLGPSRNDKKPKYEDYYPKSRTGLGGLSLSSAGSSKSFRNDLAQNFVPLVIDPNTSSAEPKSSLKVPDNCFPTINSVPGAMMSFNYYVEVVIDLRRKPSSQERFRPRLKMTDTDPWNGYGGQSETPQESAKCTYCASTAGWPCLDTTQLRREKNVITRTFAVIVGTKDSNRRKSRFPEYEHTFTHVDLNMSTIHQAGYDPNHISDVEPQCTLPQVTEGDYTSETFIPAPAMDTNLDEKSRLRQAEERLLPSAPPAADGPSSSTTPMNLQPSAPGNLDIYRLTSVEDSSSMNTLVYPVASFLPHEIQRGRVSLEHQSAHDAGANEDKQELERQRLQRLASCPPQESDLEEGETSGTHPRQGTAAKRVCRLTSETADVICSNRCRNRYSHTRGVSE